LAAVLFGISAPAASQLAGDMGAFTLAGLLYLGAAIAVLPVIGRVHPTKRAVVRGAPRLATAVVLGGAVGPVLLAAGLSHAPAATASLLLNLELVFTTILAFFVGQIETPVLPLNAGELTQRALTVREDYRAEQRRLEQYRLEQRAAERLRFPEPVLNAGLKRADIGQRGKANGPVVGITVPLPLFNKGQTEVARYSAEQERASARLEVLSRQIRGAVEGTVQALNIRQRARDEYRNQLAETGPELVRIATVAYQEGEVGILQLLDALRTQR
jgi:hypothetical protein